MNEPIPTNGPEDLRETCATLRHQLNSVLILLFLVSATLLTSFLRQSSEIGKQRDMLQQVVAGYQQQTEPAVNNFSAKLREYGKTHPDLMPILVKYGVVQLTNPAAPAAR
jgi:hypothetical protein